MRMAALCLSLLMTLTACQQPPRDGREVGKDLPQRLSQWHLLERKGDELTLGKGLQPYDLNSALFSDYAHKLRAVFVPPGTAIRYGSEDFEFPVGTIITKTFYYPRAGNDPKLVRKVLQQSESASLDLRQVRLLETRLLINTSSGWIAAPYVWNEAQTDATLELAGESFSLELVGEGEHQAFEYMVPDANQCAGCHAVDHHKQIIKPIGVKARHLNKNYQYAHGSENQLTHWQRTGLLTGWPNAATTPRNAQWDSAADGDLNARARAYLDVNCGHCHSARAAANTSGLLLDIHEATPELWGVCKIPVASGRGSGTGSFDIVPGVPEDSILLQRMESTEPDVAMPELGRAVVHQEGVTLIREWIASLSGNCSTIN
jgi:uncharacterized repeat protein (TIGR03806 family)